MADVASHLGPLPSASALTGCSTKLTAGRRRSTTSIMYVAAESRSLETVSIGLQKETRKELSRILRTEAAIKAIERKSQSKRYDNLWPRAILEALHDAVEENRWESALKILGLLRQQRWYQPRCQTYTKLLVMLAKCGRPNEAGTLFEVMMSDGIQPGIAAYTALVSAYGLSGLFDEAFSTVDSMKTVYDSKPDVYTYTVLINCCMKHRRFDLIDRVLKEMRYLGISCNTVTYNTMIDGYGKAELFEQMEEMLSAMMENESCHPDICTLNSFISALGKCGQIEQMEKWYEEFQMMGVRPDVRTFNILIRSYGKAAMYSKMESVLNFMRKRSFSPNVVTFNIVIETFGKGGNIDKMEEYFLKMKHQGMKPNRITYCSLVNAYIKAELLCRVDSVLRQIENSDVSLDTPFFNCVINAYGLAGDVCKMDQLFVSMKDRNCKPDNITFATMIKAYNSKGMTEAVEDIASKMGSMQNSSGTSSSNRLIGCQ